MKKGEIKFGDIVWIEFDPSIGHEFQNRRPAIIIQSDKQLKKSNLVTVIPLTSNRDNKTPDDIIVASDKTNNLRSDSIAKVYCITSFDYLRFIKKIGKVNDTTATKIKTYLKKHFAL
ncbi:MAG TPA: type II toxin-antitoxin system PemK/MazF family toxin [Candidatus Paceibacterota bacterium]